MCLPSPAAFQIHFQVNTVWPATNLQPTAVVTAVADNGRSKLQPGSGMFTVTTGKLAANIFFPALSKRKTLLLLILFWWITCLTLCPVPFCVARCTQEGRKAQKGAFFSRAFNFSWERNPYFESRNLKLAHNCQQLLGVWRNVPPSSHRAEIYPFPSPCPAPKKTSWCHFGATCVLCFHLFNSVITIFTT